MIENELFEAAERLERNGRMSLHRQICDRFRQAITEGRLAPGQRVASARTLAAELGLSRGTVDAAYAQLAGEGYLEPRGQKGTVVAAHLAQLASARPQAATVKPTRIAKVAGIEAGAPLPLQLGVPALDAFPRKLWARLAARSARAQGPSDLSYPDPRGYLPLREAIATYLLVSRGIACQADQVFVTAGYRGALDLIHRVLMKVDDPIWIEDPCYPPALRLLKNARARVCPVRVDADGLCVDEAIRKSPSARFALVTPAHQAPLGASLSLERRIKLLAWAQARRAWIIEDDYDSEYRYTGRPLPALKSMDSAGRVLYVGTFSKVLFPGLSLGYLIVPVEQASRFENGCDLTSGGCPQLTQAIVADFMAQGHFSRHIKKMRLLYARRRAGLVMALGRVFGERAQVGLQAAGMHLMVRIADHRPDHELARLAQAGGLAVQALSKRSIRPSADQGLLMGFTNVSSDAQALRIARRLDTLWAG